MLVALIGWLAMRELAALHAHPTRFMLGCGGALIVTLLLAARLPGNFLRRLRKK